MENVCVLYRYRKWDSDDKYARDIIERQRLHFSRISDCQDGSMDAKLYKKPDDLNPDVKMVFEYDGKEIDILKDNYEKDIIFSDMEDEIRRGEKEVTYGCYFTLSPNNDFMWKEYGDNGAGVCFEIEIKNFPGIIVPATYSDTKNVDTSSLESFFSCYYCNLPENISAEEEIRAIVDKSRLIEDGNRYYYDIRGNIKKVIYGPNIVDKEGLKKYIKEYLTNVEIEEAII